MTKARLRPFVAVGLVVLAVVVAFSKHRQRPLDSPHTIPAALALVEAKGLALRVIPADFHGDLGAGVFLTEQPQDPDRVRTLTFDSRRYADWQGVVLLRRAGDHAATHPAELDLHGEHIATVGDFLLFGDPELLARVRAAIDGGGPQGIRLRPPKESSSFIGGRGRGPRALGEAGDRTRRARQCHKRSSRGETSNGHFRHLMTAPTT